MCGMSKFQRNLKRDLSGYNLHIYCPIIFVSFCRQQITQNTIENHPITNITLKISQGTVSGSNSNERNLGFMGVDSSMFSEPKIKL